MTHLWPSMIRKPDSGASDDLYDSDEGELLDDEMEDDFEGSAAFPVTFTSSSSARQPEGSGITGPDFPGLEELRRQLPEGDEEDEEVRLEDEEYARLDDWLDDDELDQLPMSNERADQNDMDVEELAREEERDKAEGSTCRSQSPMEFGAEGNGGFEDDFDDFTPFQSGPSRSQKGNGDGSLSMDPTPLLLHLQTLRAELAGVENEDDRRSRAGKEVERVMRDLGIGHLGSDFGLGDHNDEGDG